MNAGRLSLTILIGLLVIAPVWADPGQDSSTTGESTGFVSRTLEDDTGVHRYTLFVPRAYSPDRKWPLMVFLHGAGERGTDGNLPTTVGPGPYIRSHADEFPFLVLFPQCESQESRLLTGWAAGSPDAQRMLQMVQAVEADYAVDSEHRVLTGWSMGGYGVWSIAAQTPELWSALVPVSSGSEGEVAAALEATPVWAIHGQRDNVIRPSAARAVVSALREAGGSPWLTVVPTAGHDVWRTAYESQALYDWIAAPSNAGPIPALTPQAVAPKGAEPEPFEPVLEIANAAEVRLGNRLFSGLSYAIPSYVPQSALSGSIADIHDSTNAEGYWFNVTFSRISYSAELAQAKVEAIGKNQLRLRFGLENVNLTIGATYVRGSGRAATAGPVTIGIGHRRPVWLEIVVEPSVKDRALRLRTVSSSFRIENDNWYVSSPWGVSTSGLGMTRERVSRSIVQGLYSRKSRIEREVSAAVPSIMKWVEETLDISDAGRGVAAIWPLPVYRPDVRIWPEAVTTDANGASIRLGMAAAAPTPQPLPFRKIVAEPFTGDPEAATRTLQLTVNAGVLEPLSRLLVESQAARINVLDIPGDAFAPLVSRDQLAAAVPALQTMSEDVEIQTELVLKQPFSLASLPNDPAGEAAADTMTLRAPEAVLLVSMRPSAPDSAWVPIAEFDCGIEQNIQAEVGELRDASDLKLVPASEPQIRVTGGRQTAEDNRSATADENAQFERLLTEAWQAWISGQSFADTVIDDLDFRKTRLRLMDLRFAADAVVADFEIPPIAIHNLADQPLVYQVKGPLESWSKEHTLEPGKSHQYDVDYAVTWRRRTDSGDVIYTLKPGSHSEFRYPRAGGPPVLFSR